MGLDANVYSVLKRLSKELPDVDASLEGLEKFDEMYWRKHGQLQNYFHQWYTELGGQHEDFNCVYLRLTKDKIQGLINAISTGTMPHGEGFFFGDADSDKLLADRDWAEKFLREADWENRDYFYSAWY
jgi:hypothetical protein